MATDHIRYDVLARDALRGVLRRVLTDAAEHGLPGEHHFFITFVSTAEGVKLSPRLLAQYPEEMTVILQHQFWDLVVTEDRFEVGLSFGGIPERLVVPFTAIKSFFDPSVQFGLQFDPAESAAEAPAANLPAAAAPSALTVPRRPPPPPLPKIRTSRRSRAKAPRWCGWIASARNNPRFRIRWTRRATDAWLGARTAPYGARSPQRTGSWFPHPELRARRKPAQKQPAPKPTVLARSRLPPTATGARRPNARGRISASARIGCRCRSFTRSASSSSRRRKPTANSACSTGAAPAPSPAPRAK